MDVLAHLWLAEPITAHGIDWRDIVLSPLMYFLIGFTGIKDERFFCFVFCFGYRNIDCLGFLDRNFLLNFSVFSVFVLNLVRVAFDYVRVLKLIQIEHSLWKYRKKMTIFIYDHLLNRLWDN